MKYRLKPYFLVVAVLVALSSCTTFNPSRMFKIPADFPYAKFPDSVKIEPYKIAVNDIISFSLYTNDGFKTASISSSSNHIDGTGQANTSGGSDYKVRSNGKIKMPVLGELEVVGLTVKDAEELLENKYREYFVNPFVILEITNKKVYFCRGGLSISAVTLENDNSTLFDVLAKLGGVSGNNQNSSTQQVSTSNIYGGMSYANKVKIIRGDFKNPEIYLVDLSKIEGLKDADIVMHANDIVYIEPVINYAATIPADIGVFTGLISSVLNIYLVYKLISPKP